MVKKLIIFTADKEYINSLITATRKLKQRHKEFHRESLIKDCAKLLTELNSIKKLLK